MGGNHVTDTVLRVCAGDSGGVGRRADAPHYLATVGRQGYRFLVGDDREVAPAAGRTCGTPTRSRQLGVVVPACDPRHPPGRVGQWRSRDGQDDAGGVWLARLAARKVRMHGASASSTGEGNRTCHSWRRWGNSSRGPGHREVDALQRYAPMWLVQWPGLLPETELQRLQRQLQGDSARMLRELAEVLDVLTAETPLVLFLEDLHWSDRSTVECLNYVAQRRVPARLLVLGTYRPVEAATQQHPLRHIVRELCGRGTRWICAGVAHQRGCDGLYDRAPGGSGVRPTRGRRL